MKPCKTDAGFQKGPFDSLYTRQPECQQWPDSMLWHSRHTPIGVPATDTIGIGFNLLGVLAVLYL